MNVVTVRINGIEYNLKGEEQEEYLHRVASYVDKKVKNILENNSKLSTSSAAILSAVNVADDMLKVRKLNDELVKEVNQLRKVEQTYEEQIEALKKQLQHMEEYNMELQIKLKSAGDSKYVEQKDKELKELNDELEIIKETAQRYMKENAQLKAENKEFKFQVQSAKYKVMDIQHKLVESQITLAKEKKLKNPLLKSEVK